MALMEKIDKALDALRSPENICRTKEKISHCSTIADVMCTPQSKNSSNFVQHLCLSIEVLLTLCNDDDSDTRMMADECLNRIIRAMTDSYIAKVQIELHNEIKLNRNARSLRAALWRFSKLSHFIKPQKGKPYVTNLFPWLVKISHRPEDSVYETFTESLPNIMIALGKFTTDNDIKGLIKASIENLIGESAVKRRSAATNLLTICLHSRKPEFFIAYVLNTIIDIIIPIDTSHSTGTVLGVMGGIRSLLPTYFESMKDGKSLVNIDRTMQILELCMYYMESTDHNTINAALEVMNTILQLAPPHVTKHLLHPGYSFSSIHNEEQRLRSKTSSQMSVAHSLVSIDEVSLLDSDLTDIMESSSVNKWISKSKLSSSQTPLESISRILRNQQSTDSIDSPIKSACESIAGSQCDNSEFVNIQSNYVTEYESGDECTSQIEQNQLNKNITRDSELPTSAVEIEDQQPADSSIVNIVSSGSKFNGEYNAKDTYIGTLADLNSIPLVFCVRYLSKKFLLSGNVGKLISDSSVRVSVKVLALNCIANAIKLYPNVLIIFLDKIIEEDYRIKTKMFRNIHEVENDNEYLVKDLDMKYDHFGESNTNLMLKNPDKKQVTPRDMNSDKLNDKKHILESYRHHQKIFDILSFSDHNDPQLRGLIRIIIGNFLNAIIEVSKGNYDSWIKDNFYENYEEIKFELLIQILIKGLKDNIQTSCRQSLTAVNTCLNSLTESCVNYEFAKLIYLELPTIANNPYWLVKVCLSDVVSNLNYSSISKIVGDDFQEKILSGVLYTFLADEDFRVRNTAAEALCKIIPKLYFGNDFENQNLIANIAIEKSYDMNFTLEEMKPSLSNIIDRRLCDNLMMPFCYLNKYKIASFLKEPNYKRIENNLSRIVFDMTKFLYDIKNNHFTYGVLSTLSSLINQFPATLFPCWLNCGLLDVALQVLTASSVSTNLTAHKNLLHISVNLICASALKQFENNPLIEHTENTLWQHLHDTNLSNKTELFLNHILKILNIFIHVIDDINPSVAVNKSNIPTTPVKRNILHKIEPDSKQSTTGKSKTFPLGYFANGSNYIRLYEILKSAYSNYKITLDFEASEKFLSLLQVTLESVSQLLEISTITEIGRVSEEILSYMKSTMPLDSTTTVKCVQQLLKCVFGTNFACQFEDIHQFLTNTFQVANQTKIDSLKINQTGLETDFSNLNIKSYDSNDFSLMVSDSYESFYKMILNNHNVTSKNKFGMKCKDFCTHQSRCKIQGYCYSNRMDDEINTMETLVKEYDSIRDYIKRKVDHKWGADKSSLANYIRLFEPMVIQALKQYTVTSDVILQSHVLKLLCQLLQLRVNYCLLDSDEVFIGFVLKQFEFIEQGQIRHSEILIPQILYFLLLLSYEKHHSKCIMAVPKILQLCDGLIASEQNQLTHCVPAIIPLVEDVFLMRAGNMKLLKTENVELATTKEVVFAMLLRLIEYSDIMNLFSLILTLSSQNNEHYERWSKQAIDSVLNLVQNDRLRLSSLNEKASLGHLLDVLHPDVLFSSEVIGVVLKIMFKNITDKDGNNFSQWLCIVSIFMSKIIFHLSEKDLLSHIENLKHSKSIPSPSIFYNQEADTPDPLNVSNVSSLLDHLPADVIFVRYFFRLVQHAVTHLHEVKQSELLKSKLGFIIKNLIVILQDIKFIFEDTETNPFPTISQTATNIIQNETFGNYSELYPKNENIQINKINYLFVKLISVLPILTSHWCHLLIKIKYGELCYWDIVLEESINKKMSINVEIVKTAALLSYCEYFANHGISDCEQLTWLLINHTKSLVNLSKEQPVKSTLMNVTGNQAASALLIQAVSSRCADANDPQFINNLLPILHTIHASQSGALLSLCIPRFLKHPNMFIARRAAILCCRRAEIIRTLDTSDALAQLHKDDFVKIIDYLVDLKLAKKHGTLVCILNKLSTQFYDLSPLELGYSRPINPENIKTTTLDQAWYTSQVKLRCCQHNNISQSGLELALLLNKLNAEDLKSVMNCKDFDRRILKYCVKIGFEGFLKSLTSEVGNQKSEDKENTDEVEINLLFKTSVTCIMKNVEYIISLTPRTHYVYCPLQRAATSAENKHMNRCNELFDDKSFCDLFYQTIPAVIKYFEVLENINLYLKNKGKCDSLSLIEYDHILIRFAVLCLENVLYIIKNTKDDYISDNVYLELGLKCANLIIRQQNIWNKFNSNVKYNSYICSSFNVIYSLIELISKNTKHYILKEPNESLQVIVNNSETTVLGYAFHQASSVVSWVEQKNKHSNGGQIKNAIVSPNLEEHSVLLNLIVSMCRFDILNSFALTPHEVWERGWEVTESNYKLPPIPIEILQDSDILESFVFRCGLLGWTSRHQFEETWMSLLGVLSSTQSSEDCQQSQRISIIAITRLLLSSLHVPFSGNPNVSNYLHVPRNSTINTDNIGLIKLKSIQDLIVSMSPPQFHLTNIFNQPNLERISTLNCTSQNDCMSTNDYMFSQLCSSYLVRVVAVEEGGKPPEEYIYREKCLEKSGIDLNSCLQFLVDLYSQMLSPEDNNSFQLLHIILQSILSVSDMFNSRYQYKWLMNTALDLSKTVPLEDELSHQYITLIVCKSVAVVIPDSEALEQLRAIIYQSLRSVFKPARTSAVHGLIYLLDSLVRSDTFIGGYNSDTLLIYEIAREYVETVFLDVEQGAIHHSLYHQLSTWALAFFILEHFNKVYLNNTLIPGVLQSCFTVLKQANPNIIIYRCVIHGLERLIILGKISGNILESIVQISLEKLKHHNTIYMLPALQLMTTCVYIASSDQLKLTEQSNGVVENDPDIIIRSIEKTTAIFDRIKKSIPFEAKILCSVLSRILNDLFPPSEILTKVVGEFLSTNQPHCQLIAGVVFQVFCRARECSQLALLQAWLVCSLPSFISNLSPNMSAWCLTCFFLGASTNQYLNHLFPYVQSRMGKLEYEDKKILCLAANDFFKNLSKDQKLSFITNFKSLAQDSNSLFTEMLNSLDL